MKVTFFLGDNSFSKLLFIKTPFLSNLSFLQRIEDRIMCYSGYIFCASSTVSTAHLIRSSLESECSRSLVPVLMMSDLGVVTEAFMMIDFAWLRVGQQMYFDLLFRHNSDRSR